MKIKRIGYCNWKGLGHNWTNPARVTVLSGQNGTGKSGRMEGIRYAIQGDSPAGARPDDVARYTGLLGGSVCIEIEDDIAWTRGVHRNPHTKAISRVCTVAGRPELKLTEAESLVSATVGSFAPMFDIGEFLYLSPDKRREFVLRLCSLHTPQETQAKAAELAMAWFCAERLGAAACIGKTLPELLLMLQHDQRIALEAHVAEVVAGAGEAGGAEYVSACISAAKEISKRTKREHDEAIQASRKLSERKEALAVISQSVQAINDELKERRDRLQEVARQIGDAQGRARAVASLEDQIQKMSLDRNRDATKLANLRGEKENDAACDTDAMRAEAAKAAAMPMPDESALAAAEKRLNDVRRNSDKLTKAAAESSARESDLRAELKAAERIRTEIEGGDWAKALDLFNQLISDGDLYHGDAAWEELGSLIRSHIDTGRLAEVTRKQTVIEGQLNALRAEQEQISADALALEHPDSLQAACQAEREIVSAKIKARDLARSNARLINEDARRIDRIRNDRNEAIANCEAAIARNAEGVLKAQRDIAALKDGVVNVDDLLREQEGLSAAIMELEAKRKARESYQRLETELAACIEAAERQQVEHDVADLLADGFKAVREKLMADLVAPLISRIDEFLVTARPDCHAYAALENDRGAPILDLGWIADGERSVSLPSMSGGEAGVFCAALAYALVTLSMAPLKLLLLEAAELDGTNLARVVDACAKSPGIDHAIIAYPSPYIIDVADGVECIQCGRPS